jgi:FkbM family methyltransferase
MLFFDIGANVGLWALHNYTSQTKIISVEASPNTSQQLQINCQGKNIICLNYAVTSSNQSVIDFFECAVNTISTLDEKWLNDPSSRFYRQYPYKKIEVQTITIDRLISDYGIPDILKVDVEGAENIVLKSLTQPIKTVCFEWASEWNEKTIDAINHLANLGYQQFHIQTEDKYTYRPLNYELNKEQTIKSLNSKRLKIDWGMIWTTI